MENIAIDTVYSLAERLDQNDLISLGNILVKNGLDYSFILRRLGRMNVSKEVSKWISDRKIDEERYIIDDIRLYSIDLNEYGSLVHLCAPLRIELKEGSLSYSKYVHEYADQILSNVEGTIKVNGPGWYRYAAAMMQHVPVEERSFVSESMQDIATKFKEYLCLYSTGNKTVEFSIGQSIMSINLNLFSVKGASIAATSNRKEFKEIISYMENAGYPIDLKLGRDGFRLPYGLGNYR